MKTALCTAFSLCVSFLLFAATPGPDTAYQALRTVGSERGGDTLNHVIEVDGRGGAPQPTVWRVVLDDPSARGGVRELDVSQGKIVGEHTPVNAYSGSSAGAVIDFHKLNLDSSGAFTLVNGEAEKAHIGFDTVDYTLRTGDGPNANPVWAVSLQDVSHHNLGNMTLAADTGAIVSSDIYGHPQPPPVADVQQNVPPPAPPPPDNSVVETDTDNVYASGTYQPPADVQPSDQNDYDTEDTQGLRIGHRIKKAFLAAGSSLKNFFTGKDFSNQDH
jgi:hypothetical protein